MPHPTPLQIAAGSATVVSATLLLLLLEPEASPLLTAAFAVVALTLGVAVSVAFRPRRVPPPDPVTVPPQRAAEPSPLGTIHTPHPAHSVHSAHTSRPEVRV